MRFFRQDSELLKPICVVLAFLMLYQPVFLISGSLTSTKVEPPKVLSAYLPGSSIQGGSDKPMAIVVRHAPVINAGMIGGSVWMLKPENLSLGGNTAIDGDLYAPGTPAITNGNKSFYNSVIPGTGNSQPSNYTIALSGRASVGNIHTRTDSLALPNVPAPPQPAGTRIVRLDSPGQSVGDFATLKDLSVEGGFGTLSVPPGTYGNFTANGKNGISLGIAGSSEISIYNLQNLSLSGNAVLQIVGPVVLTLANGFSSSGIVGSSEHPLWLQVKVASGNIVFDGNSALNCVLTASRSSLILNGNTMVTGFVQLDRLVINGSGQFYGVPLQNAAPSAYAGEDKSITFGDALTLNGSASDDGLPVTGTLTTQWTKVSGPGTVTFSSPNQAVTNVTFGKDGVYVLRLTANDSELSNSDDVTITVLPKDHTPIALNQSLTTPEDTPLSFTLTATDTKNDISSYSVVDSTRNGKLTGIAHNLIYTPKLNYFGSDSLTFTASDATTTSNLGVVRIAVTSVNDAPIVHVGRDTLVSMTGILTLKGTVTDDNTPDPALLTTKWRKMSGPGIVQFFDSTALVTGVSFGTSGNYMLRLIGDDSQLSDYDDINITVNQAPVVEAGQDQTVLLPGNAEVWGSVSEDGIPANKQLSFVWSQASGPGPVVFDCPDSLRTAVHFGMLGNYVLRLTASDGMLTNQDSMKVSAVPAGDNRPPVVNAGQDQIIGMTYSTEVEALVTDDGLPYNTALSMMWSVVSGPGQAGIEDPYALRTKVTFSKSGTYILRMTADDSELSGWDDIAITVHLSNMPPIVEAGQNQNITSTDTELRGFVTDDNKPAGKSLALQWSQFSGPGAVVFQSPNSGFTNVSFGKEGSYVLKLIANDSELSAFDTVRVNVTGNRPPIVEAGENKTAEVAAPINAGTPPPIPPRSPMKWIYDIGRPGVNGKVGGYGRYGIDVEGNNVYVGGVFSQAGGMETGCIAKWDRCGWTGFYDPRPKDPNNPSSPPRGFLYNVWSSGWTGIAVHEGNIYATGPILSLAVCEKWYGVGLTSIRWDGSGWKEWEVFPPQLNHAILATEKGVYKGGRGLFQPIDHNIPSTTNFPAPGIPTSKAIVRWNNNNWEIFGDGIVDILDTPTNNSGGLVYVIVEGPNRDIYVGGVFDMQTPNGMAHNIAKWNGTNWESLGLNIQMQPYAQVNALAFDKNGDLYIGGGFYKVDGVSVNHIIKAHFNSNTQLWSWSPLQNGISGVLPYSSTSYPYINSIVIHDTSAYVGGRFQYAGGKKVNCIARWDGTNWQPLAGTGGIWGVNDEVTSLASSSEGVYIGGHFTAAGGEPAGRIVLWGRYEQPKLVGRDSILVEDAEPAGAEIELADTVSQRCGKALTVTWNVDGGAAEKTIVLPEATTAIPQAVKFNYLYPPGNHFVTITVEDGKADPVVFNTIVTVVAPAKVALNGSVTDDGLPAGSELSVHWTQVSGPASVRFLNPDMSSTMAYFTKPGTYVLRLVGDDSEYSRFDEVTVQIFAKQQLNRPPMVLAGLDQSINFDEQAQLSGIATDDGLPSNSLSYSWSQTIGPGLAFFSNSNALQTTVQFNVPGTYTLRLTAGDSEFESSDKVIVRVSNLVNQPPVVEAGPDRIVDPSHSIPMSIQMQDDGLPYGTLGYSWDLVSGPAIAIYSYYNGQSYVSLVIPGEYKFRLTAYDGILSAIDSVTITVRDTYVPIQTKIQMPFDGCEVTSPVEIIGTVAGTFLSSWSLSYREKGENGWKAIGTGIQPVMDGVLGSFDPTLLANGMYEILLTGVENTGYAFSDTACVVVKGGMKIGNFSMSFVDLDVPVCGLPIQITRTYDSRDKKTHDFGAGWTLDIRDFIIQESCTLGEYWRVVRNGTIFPNYTFEPLRPHIVTITARDGTVHEFDVTLSPKSVQIYPPQVATVSFTPRRGTNSQLMSARNTDLWVYGTVPGPIQLIDMGVQSVYDPSQYSLILNSGQKLEIDKIEGLRILTDTNSNSLTVDQNGITHSSGLGIIFNRDSQGRITSITDPMSHSIYYAYDSNGDLIRVTDRDNYTTTFTYGANHYLTDITDPRGVKVAKQLYNESGRMIAMVDAEGDTIHLTHNIGSRQEVVKDRLGNITVYEYDEQGNVISQTDAKGNITSYTYDALGHKLTETDSKGNTRRWTYDSTGNMLTETDSLNNITRYTYNTLGQMLTKTDPMGSVTTYIYDVKGNRIQEISPLGHVIHYIYDEKGNLLTSSDQSGNIASLEYDWRGWKTSETDALGNKTSFTYYANGYEETVTKSRTTSNGVVSMVWTKTYDGRGNETSITDPGGNIARTEYNSLGKKSADIDKLGRRTEYVYDAKGNESRIVYPDSTEEIFTYNEEGKKVTESDRAGRITTYEYDATGNATKIITPDGAVNQPKFDEKGKVTSVIDERGNTRKYQYDLLGRNTSIITAVGDSIKYEYDNNGNQIKMIDANRNAICFEYDAKNRKTKTIFSDGTFVSVTYDFRGNKISETDQAGKTTYFEFDALNHLIKVTDALGNQTLYSYDELGNRITQTDANGNTTYFEYDNLGRMTKRTLQLGMSETRTYDAEGNVISLKDFNGNTTSFQYDKNNRLVKKNFPNGSIETCEYTATGQRKTMTDNRGTTQFEYNARDRLIRRIDPDGKSIEYAYDLSGNRTIITIGSDITSYTFDAANRLLTAKDPAENITQYNYDSMGNRKNIIYPNGTIAEYTYDSLNRLTGIVNRKSNGEIISSYTYTIGPSGNRNKATEKSGRVVEYLYDETYKLIQEIINDPDFGIRKIDYIYDAVGNRLKKIDNGDTTVYTYDANDRLLSENDILYTYDNNGNTMSKTSLTENINYSYDYQNHLVKVTNGSSIVEYVYDHDGIRVQKSVNGSVTKYLVDKNRDYAQVLQELDNSGNILVTYHYGDDLISQNRNETVAYYHYDGQMSTRQLTDVAQNVTDGYTYDAFGVLINRFGATQNDYLYSGEQYDPNVGFYYLRSRYYMPNLGRFFVMDTWQGNFLEPLSLHKYIYTHNNPIRYQDPSGKWILPQMVCVIVISGILASIQFINKAALPFGTDRFGMRIRLGTYVSYNLFAFGGMYARLEEKDATIQSDFTLKLSDRRAAWFTIILIGLGFGCAFTYTPIDYSEYPEKVDDEFIFKTNQLRRLELFAGIGRISVIGFGLGHIGLPFALGYTEMKLPDGTWLKPSASPGFEIGWSKKWGGFSAVAIWKMGEPEKLYNRTIPSIGY